MDSVLIWIFLFLALIIGWLLGYSAKLKRSKSDYSRASKQGEKHRLQLLFDSYSDDAIDRLINSLDVSKETFQTHLSIGTHFRKQGEVEKAILIHQNLMAHPEISHNLGDSVIFELAKDYKAAGLFDRAESLLKQLIRSKEYAYSSQVLLLDICEIEKDWEGALDIVNGLDLRRHPELNVRVSQYYCELASLKLRAKQKLDAFKLYKSAISANKLCVRAVLGQAEIAILDENFSEAIRLLKYVAEISPVDLPLALPQLLNCTIQTQTFVQHQAYLKSLYKETGQIGVMLAIVASMEAQGCEKEAFKYLTEQLSNLPSLEALNYLFNMEEMSGEIHHELAGQLIEIVARENDKRAKFQCTNCGFSAGQVHWNCPSCKSWQTVKPVLEYEKKVSN
jgi:lipopolysaccharide biosynthesis regulator YciM